MSDSNRLYKWLFVIVLVVFSLFYIYPPSEKLKGGIDLVGGSSLLFEIDTKGLSSSEQRSLSTRVMEILKERVDPGARLNLEWRPIGFNRLEIRMPRPPAAALARRDRYNAAVDTLKAMNVSRFELETALNADPAERHALIADLGRGVTARANLLDELATRFDAYQPAQEAFRAGEVKLRDARAAAREAKQAYDAQEEKTPEVEQAYQAAQAALQAAREQYDIFALEAAADQARDAYEELMAEVLATNLPVKRLADVLAIEQPAQREKELEALRAEFPDYDRERPRYSEAEAAELRRGENPPDDVDGTMKPLSEAVAAYAVWAQDKADLEDPADLKRRLKGVGVLEFRVLADRDPANTGMTQSESEELREEIAKYAEELARVGPRETSGKHYRWFPIEDVEDFMHLKSVDEFEEKKEKPEQPIVEQYAGQYYVLSHNDPEFGMTAESKWGLKWAYADRDPLTSRNLVRFQLDPRGGLLFGDLTGTNVQRQLCIFLDGTAVSHATIQGRIGAGCQITGDFTPERVQDLSRTLQAGALPARLKETPLMEKTVGPSLGETNRQKGLYATVIGLAIVVVFMIFYYGLTAGGMADVALLMNLLFILSVMAITQSTFTLPGIAGVILTVGMAVDANVLIFERIREERDRGIGFRKALNAGYDKAFSTIMDANLTTLITCVVLGFLGSEEVKGFAMTLGIGITTSMFTSLFVTRLVFNSLISAGWLKGFSMRRIIGTPTVDWLALRSSFWPFSIAFVVAGVAAFSYIGSTDREAIYDIEFLGGTSVQLDLREESELANEEAVRRHIASTDEKDESAVNWLRNAADQLLAAEVGMGEGATQYTLVSPDLTGQEMDALMHAELEDDLERDGVHPVGRSVAFDLKPGTLTRDQFRERVVQAADAARAAADNLRNVRVQSVTDIVGQEEGTRSFEVVTVETNRRLVQAAIVAALGEKNLKIEKALSFTTRMDDEINLAPYFAIEFDDRYLSDVLGGDVTFDVRGFKGGVAIEVNLDEEEDPLPQAEFERRLREICLQPEFEQYEARDAAVIPLDAGIQRADGKVGYRRFAVCAVDKELLYEPTDPEQTELWRDSVAQIELEKVQAALGHEKSLSKVTQFEAQIAGQVQQQAIFAVAIALAAIVAYVWMRFGTALFGLAAIVALVHDVSITLGLVTICHFAYDNFVGRALLLSDFKIDLAMMAAILTVIGYSLNDTIVVFDRIRENRGRLGALSAPIINNSINQTLSRTLLTSITTLMVVLMLYIFGGKGVHGFAFALLVGIGVGTYSSIAIAAPLLYRPKVLVHVVLLIVLLGVVGMILVMTTGTTTRLVLIAVALVLYILAAVKARHSALVAPRRTAASA